MLFLLGGVCRVAGCDQSRCEDVAGLRHESHSGALRYRRGSADGRPPRQRDPLAGVQVRVTAELDRARWAFALVKEELHSDGVHLQVNFSHPEFKWFGPGCELRFETDVAKAVPESCGESFVDRVFKAESHAGVYAPLGRGLVVDRKVGLAGSDSDADIVVKVSGGPEVAKSEARC